MVEKICARCGRPVVARVEHYETFQKMHWLCFHLEFEHQADPDVACSDPSCPLWHIEVYREALRGLGADPDAQLELAIKRRYGA